MRKDHDSGTDFSEANGAHSKQIEIVGRGYSPRPNSFLKARPAVDDTPSVRR